jgi:hypothetical protein
MTLLIVIQALLLQVAAPSPSAVCGLPLTGREAEDFLRSARVVAIEDFKTVAVTRPQKVELTDGHRTCYAVFKTIDEREPRRYFSDGTSELRFSDRYQYEIAAYELNKLLGLAIVPPTVERRIDRETGSLSLRVEESITEWERLMVRDIHPPDVAKWNNQMYTILLFQQLIYDTDYQNINNLLVTPNWKIYKIDSSRAFRCHKKLSREESLERFSRHVLDSLRELSKAQLEKHLLRCLSKKQISALWVRRGLILDLADRRIAERGEKEVLFD